MVISAHLKNKIRFISRNSKLKIPLNCTDGTTLRQYGIYRVNKSISSAHNILPENAFNSSNDHENFVH